MGFTFDDTDKKGVASSLAEMQRLIEADPRNREVIFPYIGGEEVNTSPTHAHHRYVIHFRDYPLRQEDLGESWRDAGADQRQEWLRKSVVPLDYPEPVAADWLDLLEIVEERVKPERTKVNRKVRRDRWWQFGDRQPALSSAIDGLERVLTISRVGQQAALTFLPPNMVYAETTIVFPFDTFGAFCALQSRSHEIWARFFGSSMKDDLRYTPSDCFETFPFPEGWETHPALETAGKAYYEFRAALMVRKDEGMTKTYTASTIPTRTTPTSASSASCTPPWTALSSTPTGGATSPPTAISFSTTRSTKPPGAGRRSRTATAGRTPSETRCSPACSRSTPNAPPRKPVPAHRRLMPYKPNRSPQDRQQ